jgi:hypothetical protein
MAQYNGFKCDSCGAVVDSEERTKRTVKFDGPEVSGEYTDDLCPDCVQVPEGVVLRPLRRRGGPARQPGPAEGNEAPQDPSPALGQGDLPHQG